MIPQKTMVYAFGCRGPREGREEIDQQIYLAHRYYNKLIELRRAQQKECNDLRRERFPEYDAAEDNVVAAENAVETILAEIGAANAKARRKTKTPEQAAVLKAAKQTRTTAWKARTEIRRRISADAELQAALALVYTRYEGEVPPGKINRSGGLKKEARAACGVYWGTYRQTEDAVEAAVKMVKNKELPAFKPWQPDGLIGLQIQGGTTWAELQSGTGNAANLLRIEPLPTTRAGKNSARPWLIAMCVRKNEQREPVWARFKAYIHRPLPDDAVVVEAALVRRATAVHRMSDGCFHPNYTWSFQLTLNTHQPKPKATEGAVGIDLGWRLMEDRSIRVAVWVSDRAEEVNGTPTASTPPTAWQRTPCSCEICQTAMFGDANVGELRLPVAVLRRWKKSRELQSIRDLNFDRMRDELVNWKTSLTAVPDWLAEATRYIGLWKAKKKLARVIGLWQPIDGGDDILAALRRWQEQDAHLWQWQVSNERKAQRIRLHLYREFAARIRTQHAKVHVEDCDWRILAKAPTVADLDDKGVRTYMRPAAVGLLRNLLVQDGARPRAAENTTKRCSACGSIESWDQAAELVHQCEACGKVLDQDINAAINLLTDDEPDTPQAPETPPAENGAKGKWGTRKAKKRLQAPQEAPAS